MLLQNSSASSDPELSMSSACPCVTWSTAYQVRLECEASGDVSATNSNAVFPSTSLRYQRWKGSCHPKQSFKTYWQVVLVNVTIRQPDEGGGWIDQSIVLILSWNASRLDWIRYLFCCYLGFKLKISNFFQQATTGKNRKWLWTSLLILVNLNRGCKFNMWKRHWNFK